MLVPVIFAPEELLTVKAALIVVAKPVASVLLLVLTRRPVVPLTLVTTKASLELVAGWIKVSPRARPFRRFSRISSPSRGIPSSGSSSLCSGPKRPTEKLKQENQT